MAQSLSTSFLIVLIRVVCAASYLYSIFWLQERDSYQLFVSVCRVLFITRVIYLCSFRLCSFLSRCSREETSWTQLHALITIVLARNEIQNCCLYSLYIITRLNISKKCLLRTENIESINIPFKLAYLQFLRYPYYAAYIKIVLPNKHK